MKKLAFLSAFALLGCVAEPDFTQETDLNTTVNENGNFDFATIGKVKVNFTFLDAKNKPFGGLKLELVDPKTNEVIYKAFTNAQGILQDEVNIPKDMDQVILETNYIGLPNRVILPVRQGTIRFDYLGKINPEQVIQYEMDPNWIIPTNAGSRIANSFSIEYLYPYNGGGLPNNMEPTLDYISSSVLESINASLPEGKPVPTFHSSFLADGKKTTLEIKQTADVWLTYVHEGAGWRNSIGYYTYPTIQPPQTLADIKSITVLFPNFSGFFSGGELRSGHKLNIGRFQPGTTVGIVILSNGWNGSKVEGWNYPLFADKHLNPEPNPDLKQHNVLLWDEENELFVLGFEDVRRDNIPMGSDEDFNDAVMLVTSNPVRAISTVGVSPVDKPNSVDSDGDGINDNLDEYPTDPTKAYDSYYPSASGYGSFAFEDRWPEIGDYDFNDLVVDYQFKHTLNAANQVTEISPKFKFIAIGGGHTSGFGFSMDITPDKVTSVSGNRIGTLIKSNPNGTEAGQQKAVFIVTDDTKKLFNTIESVNTRGDLISRKPVELQLTIKLTQPLASSALGSAPYNPFLIIDTYNPLITNGGGRDREVHLPGYAPTNLINTRFFGTADDNSNPTTGYFKSKTDLPWAIHTPETFAYPREKFDIRSAYLKFSDWSKSSGSNFPDWFRYYRVINGDYRRMGNIYPDPRRYK
jgi:LruC domain-containing protein